MSKPIWPFFVLLLGASALPAHGFQPVRTQPVPQVLWYRQPTWQPEGVPYGQQSPGQRQGWVEALPVGNGRMGAIVFSGIRRERIQLNEESVWDGYQSDRNNSEAVQALPEVRRLIFAGKNEEATQLAGMSLMGVPTSRVKSFQPLGDWPLPGGSDSPRRTPELVLAARKSLEGRRNTGGIGFSSGGGTGWSRSWLMLFYARLGDRQEAYKHHQALLANFMLPNLFGTHPPFQIDANFSGAAGVAEMLLQSREDELSLLPALPAQWASGRVRGLRGRGGYTVDLQWREGRLAQSDIHAYANGTCRVRADGPVQVTLNGKAVESRAAGEGVATFAAAAGKTYRLTAAPSLG